MARLLSRVEATLWTGPRGHSGAVRTAAGGEERSSLLLPSRTTFRSPPPPLTALRGGIRASLESPGAEGSRVKRLSEVPGRRAQKVGGGGDSSAGLGVRTGTGTCARARGGRKAHPRRRPPPALRALPRVPLRTRRAALRAEQPPPPPPLFGGRASGPSRDLPLLAGAAAYRSVGEEPSYHCGRSAGASEGWGAARGAETRILSARLPVPGGGGAEHLRAPARGHGAARAGRGTARDAAESAATSGRQPQIERGPEGRAPPTRDRRRRPSSSRSHHSPGGIWNPVSRLPSDEVFLFVPC